MNYPCALIQDLLPLYRDGLCSEESKKEIETHLSTCPDCHAFYTALREGSSYDADRECQKAASFQAVKKKLLQKQILAAVAILAVLAILTGAVIGILKTTVEVVEYKDNLSVSMVDGTLVGRLQGSQQTHLKIKRVKNTLFFSVSDTKWDALITGHDVFSEYTLCPRDKGADQIDAVYYFTGEYEGLESLPSQELQAIIESSQLLWSRS